MKLNLPKKEPKPIYPGKYKIDLFNKNPIFLIKKNGVNHFVKSWEEAYAMSKINSINDINLEYVAKMLNFEFTNEASP